MLLTHPHPEKTAENSLKLKHNTSRHINNRVAVNPPFSFQSDRRAENKVQPWIPPARGASPGSHRCLYVFSQRLKSDEAKTNTRLLCARAGGSQADLRAKWASASHSCCVVDCVDGKAPNTAVTQHRTGWSSCPPSPKLPSSRAAGPLGCFLIGVSFSGRGPSLVSFHIPPPPP